jgi:hypothetical protein
VMFDPYLQIPLDGRLVSLPFGERDPVHENLVDLGRTPSHTFRHNEVGEDGTAVRGTLSAGFRSQSGPDLRDAEADERRRLPSRAIRRA